MIALLDVLLPLLLIERVIHIEQVTQTMLIVKTSTHISLLLCQNFTSVLCNESSHLDVFKCDHAPHHQVIFLHPGHLKFVMLLVFRLHQVVKTNIFVASAQRMALTKSEYFIEAIRGSGLDRDHPRRLSTDFLVVGWV